MQGDPLTSKSMRVMLIIAGVIIFGAPIYYLLAWGLGVTDTTIAVFVLLAVLAYFAIRRYFNRRRVDKPAGNQPYISTGITRDWPQKYSKHRREQYTPIVNKRGKPQTSRSGGTAARPLRFLHSVALHLTTRSEMDKRLDNRLHHRTRWSDEIYP